MKISKEWIQAGVDALKESGIVNTEGLFAKEFKGYISAFGAACIQSGLLPAVMFYEDDGESKAGRSSLVKAIVVMLVKVKQASYKELKNEEQEKRKLSKYLLERPKEIRSIQTDVSMAAAALKLALRIYKEDSDEDNN